MEAYCPNCKTSHIFIATTFGWRCNAAAQPAYFSNSELNEAFLNLRKDPEYASKGISVSDIIVPNSHETEIPDTIGPRWLLTLPIDSQERKSFPLLSGCLKYFAAALASVARTSKLGNDKHNPGQPLHHARDKSMDHGDCIIRHLLDIEDMIAANMRASAAGQTVPFNDRQVLDEAGSLAWRALAYSQELHERLGAAPMAPGAKET